MEWEIILIAIFISFFSGVGWGFWIMKPERETNCDNNN